MFSLELKRVLSLKGCPVGSTKEILGWFQEKGFYITVEIATNQNDEFKGYVAMAYYKPFSHSYETNIYSTQFDAIESLLFEIQRFIYE